MSNKRKLKWTPEAHILLYTEVVKKFGPYNTWETAYSPNHDRTEYKDFLSHIASHISFISGCVTTSSAVELQLKWAFTKQDGVGKNQIRQYLSNKYWGLISGFLTLEDIPSQILCEYVEKE